MCATRHALSTWVSALLFSTSRRSKVHARIRISDKRCWSTRFQGTRCSFSQRTGDLTESRLQQPRPPPLPTAATCNSRSLRRARCHGLEQKWLRCTSSGQRIIAQLCLSLTHAWGWVGRVERKPHGVLDVRQAAVERKIKIESTSCSLACYVNVLA